MRTEIHVGITFQIGAMSSNQFAKLDITLSDINSEVPLLPQIAGGIKAATQAFEAAVSEIDRQVEKLYGNARAANKLK